MNTWTIVFQAILIAIALTFLVLIIMSFAQSGRHQKATDRIAEMNAERELLQARADLAKIQMQQMKGPDSGAH